jgi:chromate transporter
MLVTLVVLWKVRKMPEPVMIALAAVAGLIVYPLIKV